MQLVCSLYDMKNAKAYAKYVSYMLLDTPIISKKNVLTLLEEQITPILKLNIFLHPLEVEDWKKRLKEYTSWNCLFYITDLGMAHILKELGAISRVIYDPITMIPNHLDALEYSSYGFYAVGLSNEIPLNDVKKILEHKEIKGFYQGFGYRQMFYSRRKLISLYEEKIGTKGNHKNMFIQEATRQDQYPIYETEAGTYIYRNYLISLLEVMHELPVTFLYLEGLQLENEIFLEVLKIYREYQKNPNTVVPIEKMRMLNLPIQDGFLFQDTVYHKEEF